MEPVEYTVVTVNGDYAMLRRDGAEEGEELNPVAMALLPFGVDVGMRLRWENFEYSII
ncbi:MAG: hypothetical protein HFJ85_04435 [Oscillospiraceae bacterium]|nr:hypothetical protein [Oscillospiraceae bacterium]